MKKLVLTHGYFLEEDPKEKIIMRPYPPLGILSISAYLEEKGIENHVIDTTFISFHELLTALNELKPAYLGIYVNLMTKINVIKIINSIRLNNDLKDTVIILGGPDVRYNSNDYLKHGADFLVLGEGEETLYELILNLEQCKVSDIPKINGIAFIDENKNIITTQERTKISNIDLLPFPNRKKIDLNKYLDTWKTYHGQNAISVSTMRGCPYTCKWCSRAVYGMSYRRRSPAIVVDELEMINNDYKPDTIWFVDDVFTISHKWLRDFAQEIEKRELKMSYECITRSDRMNEEVVNLLKKSGCFRVWIGSESGSQNVIDLMDRRVNVEQVREMIKLTKKHGIEAGTFIMLGYPGETESDIEATIKHLKDALPDYCTFTVAYPIKGTSLFYEIENNMYGYYNFEKDTDRERDFKRTYNRKYYDYAVQRVHSEYNFHLLKSKNRLYTLDALKLKVKSISAKVIMQIEKLRLSGGEKNS